MKVYVAAKPSGAVVGVFKSTQGADRALGTSCLIPDTFDTGLWRYPDGSVIQSFELEPEQLRPRGTTINVTIGRLNLEAMVKGALEEAIAELEAERLKQEFLKELAEVKRGLDRQRLKIDVLEARIKERLQANG